MFLQTFEQHINLLLFFLDISMESSNQQRCQRKKITRKIFSPSESDVYALVHFDDSGERGIIKYGDVLTERDGELELRSGKLANLLFVGMYFTV